MKRIFTLLAGAFLASMTMAQPPEAVIQKATVAPIIDGTVDDIWGTVDSILIDQPFTGESPTVGEAGETWWKALWDDNGVYILVNVNDDIFEPAYGATNEYLYDKIEIYFDTNFDLDDGGGPLTDGNGGGNGHYQFAPSPIRDSISSGEASSTGANGARFSYNVTDPNYLVEYFIPFTKLLDGDGAMVDKTAPIGFDITVSDNDVAAPGGVRNRMVWANVGTVAESWSNMDDAGAITLEGAEPGIDITALAITGGTEITADNGTLQFAATVTPTDATQGYKWIVTNGTGEATITNNGLLTAIRNGTVTVHAASSDDFVESNEVTVTISNQVLTLFELSYIKDGDFTLGTATTQSSFWTGGAAIENGVMTISNPTAGTNPWDYTISQTLHIPESVKDSTFILQFKAWADEERVFDIDIEHIGGEPYTRFGDSPDSTAVNAESQWHLTLTTEPTVYKLNITDFSRMDPARQQGLNLFAGQATPKVYIDSIILVTQGDFVLPARRLVNSINKVYPNPVGNGNALFVELSKSTTTVAIYNAVGQRLMEKAVTGNLVKFDVSNLRKGMYFVKLSDGSVQKFIR